MDTAYYDSCSYKPPRTFFMSLLDTAFSVEALHESFMEIRKSIHFKYNVQNYRLNELSEIADFRLRYANGTFQFSESHPFCLIERGHERYIDPVVFKDRVVVHSFCKNILLPKLTPYLIYDNCASLEGAGIDKSLDRFRVHLKKYYMKYGTNQGFVLKLDIRKYFDNINHDILMDMIQEKITDGEVITFLSLILENNKLDVSYMTDDEYLECMTGVFDSLKYKDNKGKRTGEKFLEKSMGIGSEASQIIGLFYLSKLDNYIKNVCGFKYYDRYMDDMRLIYPDKQKLYELLSNITIKLKEVGLYLNTSKTQIQRLDKPINYLKTTYILTDTGKVIMRKNKDTFTRERRKLKSFANKLSAGEMTYKQIENSYKSWRGSITRCRQNKASKVKYKKPLFKNTKQVQRIDDLYNQLFIEPFIQGLDYVK